MTDFINAKTLKCIVHNYIDPDVIMEEGSFVWWFAVVLAGTRLGKHVMIGSRTEIGFRCTIGDYSRIGSGVFLPSDTVVGKYVFIGPNVTCTDDRTPKVPTPGSEPYHAEPPFIDHGAAIGAGAVILPGVKIGAYARIAAGAVVTRDVEPFAMVVGMPAREREPSAESKHWIEAQTLEPLPTPQPQGI